MSTDSVEVELPEFPMPRAAGCPFDPPPALHELQRTAAVSRVRLWDGSTPWLVTGYHDQRALYTDPRISADSSHPGYPSTSAAQTVSRRLSASFIAMDDPAHARLRRMVTGTFAVRRMRAMQPVIQQIVDDLIDDLLAGPTPADLVQRFALPVPSLVICALLGVPYADHDFFQANTRVLIDRTTSPEQAATSTTELIDYLEGLVGDKITNPGDDLLSALAARVTDGELTQQEAARMGRLMLVAGHETTANMISLGTLALLRHPDQLAALRDTDDPARIATAVEELLRYLNIVHSGRRRVAIADIEIGGHTIRAGDGVILPNDIANRDPEVFPDGGELDIDRNAHGHVAFGFGVHQCLGQTLARVELQVVYGTLYRRIPTLALATDFDQIRFKHEGLIYGVHELPVTW